MECNSNYLDRDETVLKVLRGLNNALRLNVNKLCRSTLAQADNIEGKKKRRAPRWKEF